MASCEVKLWFLSSLEHFWPDPYVTLAKVALFFEKMQKVFKNKAQGCSTPLSTPFPNFYESWKIIIITENFDHITEETP